MADINTSTEISDVNFTMTTLPNADEYLRSLSDKYALNVIPAIAFLGIILIVGFVGNVIVCYIYVTKFKTTTTKCFVTALASFDLLSCCVAVPAEIFDMVNNYTFQQVALCKILRFCNCFSAVASGLVLVAISIDRYKKICRPLSTQMTVNLAKLAVGVSSLVSLAVSFPSLILYGSRSVATEYGAINGSDCSTQDRFVGTIYPIAYNGVQFFVFIVSTSILVVLYLKIWRKISKQVELRKTRVSFSSDKKQQQKVRIMLANRSSTSGSDFSSPSTKDSDVTTETTANRNKKSNEQITSTVTNESDNESKKPKRPVKRKKSVSEQKARKTTFMLFLITLVFVLSFLPHLGLMAARAFDKVFFDSLSPAANSAYNLFLRSYFLNCASNPIIYGFCNLQFRTECKALFSKPFQRGVTSSAR